MTGEGKLKRASLVKGFLFGSTFREMCCDEMEKRLHNRMTAGASLRIGSDEHNISYHGEFVITPWNAAVSVLKP